MTALLLPASVPRPLARWLADRYELLDEIGRGGTSVVHRARDRHTGREVAVKLVDHAAGDPAALEQFAREAQIAGALQHPNVVQTLAAKAGGGAAALVTEYVAGGTLRAALRVAAEAGERWPYARVAAVLRDVASALAHAHAAGVVHRDVKPENVLLEDGTGRACLADFGIAVLLDRFGSVASGGEAAGTPSYMAPEQIAGRCVDERTDVYALGLVGWEMLAGRRPWEGEPLHLVLHNQQYAMLPPLAALRPDIPAYLLAAVEGALAKDPRGRWRDGAEFLRMLSPTPARLPPVVVPDHGAEAATVRFTDRAGEAHVGGVGTGRRVRRTVRRAPGRAVLVGAAAAVAFGAVFASATSRRGGVHWPSRPLARAVVGAAPRAAPRAAPMDHGAAYAPVLHASGVRAALAPDLHPPAAAAPSSSVDRRLVQTANAQVATAYAALAEAMRQSAGPDWEPRALHELRMEQSRWEHERARACGGGRDAACLADLAARKLGELERRRARFALDGAAGSARAPDPSPAAGAGRPR